ncbi:hypothetical protein GQ457_13G017450 [Hibiscus cannabinus]
MEELRQVWESLDREERPFFFTTYGDIAHLLYVQVDETMLHALIQFWNPGYRCFTLNGKELMPTVEEYNELLRIPNVREGRVYTKPEGACNRFIALSQLAGRNTQWAEKLFSKKGGILCFPWYSIAEIAHRCISSQWLYMGDALEDMLRSCMFGSKCYDHDWLMLLGLWGAIGCAPLLVSRQFESRQFVPYTAGLGDSEFSFDTEFKKRVTNINKNWKHCYWIKTIYDSKGMVTPDRSLEVELADARAEIEKMGEKHTRDLFLKKVEVDEYEGKAKEMKMNHGLVEDEKRKGKEIVKQYQHALEAEKDNTAAWKRKSHDSKICLIESQSAYNALEAQFNQSRDQYAKLEARISIQVLEDIKAEGNDYWFTRLRDAACRFQEQDKTNEKIMNLAQDVAKHVTTIAREARILRPHFDSRFFKISHRYFTRSKASTMDMEARMTTMETNHQILQDKFEKLQKDLKEEIAQAQRNTVGQIALMLGLPDPRKGKGVEESIPVGDSPYIPGKTSHHAKEQYEVGNSKTKVQFDAGTAANLNAHFGNLTVNALIDDERELLSGANLPMSP